MSIVAARACRRRTASRVASCRASGCTVRRSSASCSACADRKSTWSTASGTADARHLVAPAQLGGPPPCLVGDHLAERRDAVPDLAAQQLVGEAVPPAASGRAQVGQDPGEQRLRGEHAQRLVRRPRRAARRARGCRCPTAPDRPSASTTARASSASACECRRRAAARRAGRAARRRRPVRRRRRHAGHVDLAVPAPTAGSTGRRACRTPRAARSGAAAPRPAPRAAARGGEVQRAEHAGGVDRLARARPRSPCRAARPTNSTRWPGSRRARPDGPSVHAPRSARAARPARCRPGA